MAIVVILMGYSLASGDNGLWVIVWHTVVIFMGYCVVSGVNFLRVLCGEKW